MSTTALLVRWSQGYTETTYPGATVREEGFFQPGRATTETEAVDLADAVLAKEAERKETIDTTAEGAFGADLRETVTAPDTAGTASTWRVLGLSYSQDGENNVVVSPMLELVP